MRTCWIREDFVTLGEKSEIELSLKRQNLHTYVSICDLIFRLYKIFSGFFNAQLKL